MEKAYLTDWVDVKAANELIKKMIADGKYKKDEIKKSSNKFKNGKNKADGYVTRVTVVPGIHPELEVEINYRKKKAKTVDVKKVAEQTADGPCEGGMIIDGKRFRTVDATYDYENSIYHFFLTDGKDHFHATKQNVVGAKAEIVAGPMTQAKIEKLWKSMGCDEAVEGAKA